MTYEGEGEQEREEGYMRKGAWWSEETREKEDGRLSRGPDHMSRWWS